ncbi:hypothetical protein FGB62_9g31 [Gracilaria domingensis]|nr:hypothetical protein FGB62_9g31 [Gracilaria domingensis]
MITIPIDSRFVNAVVYIVIDVIVYAVLVLALVSLQGWLTKQSVLRGERVSLREFRFSPLAGGVIADGNRFSALLVAVHFVLLGILFALALGINGRTAKAKRPTSRQYISILHPRTAPVVTDNRVYPQIMAGCTEFENERLTYYPVAFNQEETPSIPVSARHLRRSLNDNIGTAINSGSVVCQKFKGAKAMLTVSRCGTDENSCCNLSLSPRVRLDLEEGQDGPNVWQRNHVHRNESSIIMMRNVKPVSYDMSRVTYDRLICLHFAQQSDTNSTATTIDSTGRMNCMLGTWGADATKFIFRLGNATFPDSRQEEIFDNEQVTSVQFTAFSVETEIGWDALAEITLTNGLHSIGGNMVPARLFLDTLVSRSSVPTRITDEAIFEQYDINVTDVSTPAVIGYAILCVLAAFIALSKAVLRLKSSACENEHQWVPDITTYDGLLMLLKGDDTRRCAKRTTRPKVEFGITCVGPLHSWYSFGPVEEGDRVVNLPKEGILRWHRCIEDVMSAAKDDETLDTSSISSV